MKLIIGLGNPGLRYAATRHNVGFRIIDLLSRRHRIRLKRTRLRGLAGTGMIAGEEVALVQPTTYMNDSGLCVGPAVQRWVVALEDLLVVCDDVHLALGALRLRRKGSAGGHHGLESVIEALGTSELTRLRIGVGQPAPWQDWVDYVLRRFEREEMPVIGKAIALAADAVECWLAEGVEAAMNRFNERAPTTAQESQAPQQSDTTRTDKPCASEEA
jgi:PTH1 family peptidyl-tRNA hydrolase